MNVRAGRPTIVQECPNDFYVSFLNGLNERGVSALIYVEARVRHLDSGRGGDRKNPDVPGNSMSTDGVLCRMAWTAVRSPSATAFRREEAIVLVGKGCRGETNKDQEVKGRRVAETGAEARATWRWCNKE